jgi:hypothetical protein
LEGYWDSGSTISPCREQAIKEIAASVIGTEEVARILLHRTPGWEADSFARSKIG